MSKTKLVIGIDFDNTIISYDEAMHQTALELKFIAGNTVVQNKKLIRDYIRELPEGELKWQRLQAEVYGKRMDRACLMEGVGRFIKACTDQHIPTFIVSHKSKYAAQDTDQVNLQTAALNWMRQNHFFDKSGLGLSEDRVYFEDSREEKAGRIKTLSCTHFVDDLQEFLLEQSFPKETFRMLFSPTSAQNLSMSEGITAFRSWNDIYHYFFVKS